MAFMLWSWAEVMMERVTRGRVKKVQVRLQRRACCDVRCACRTSACVRFMFDACCSKRWLIFRSVAAHRSGCIKRAAAFILVRRLLLPPALQADTFFCLHKTETALLCFVMSLLMLLALTNGSNCPHPPSAPNSFSTLSCGKFNLLLVYSAGTLLHYVAAQGRLEVTRLLVESKADVGPRMQPPRGGPWGAPV